MKYILTATAVSAALFLTGCHTGKKATYKGNVETLDTSNNDTRELFTRIADSYEDWQDLYVPVTLSLVSPKRFNVSGRATMVQGKEINLSLRMLGFEVAVVYINETTIYVVDKYHKMYVSEEITNLLADYDLTITDIQNLLLGRITSLGHGTITPDDARDFNFLSSDSQWVLTPKKQRKDTDVNYIATMTDPPVLSDISLRIKNKGVVNLNYSEPTITPAGITAGILSIFAPIKDTEAEASITLNYAEAKWNEGRTVNFKTPNASYKKIDIESLIKKASSEKI